MADVACSHCARCWDVFDLRHESVNLFVSEEVGVARGLGSVEETLAFLAVVQPEVSSGAAKVLAGDAAIAQPVTFEGLFDFICEGYQRREGDPAMVAAETVFNAAVYRAVLRGEGCPSCGFAHSGVGPYRGTTLRQVAVGGVTDHDPLLFLRADDAQVGLPG